MAIWVWLTSPHWESISMVETFRPFLGWFSGWVSILPTQSQQLAAGDLKTDSPVETYSQIVVLSPAVDLEGLITGQVQAGSRARLKGQLC